MSAKKGGLEVLEAFASLFQMLSGVSSVCVCKCGRNQKIYGSALSAAVPAEKDP